MRRPTSLTRYVPGEVTSLNLSCEHLWQAARLVYSEHNPGKIGEVPELLRKYKGKERKLMRKLEKKYAPKEEADPEFDWSTLD